MLMQLILNITSREQRFWIFRQGLCPCVAALPCRRHYLESDSIMAMSRS